MTSEIDIYRSASAFIAKHGDHQAPLRAAILADSFLAVGDMDGAATWRKIIKAIEVLLATEPDGVTH
ncbi:MAG: hypothetical protein O6944_00305 [Gammaproteobacteria bacterium]|nr:hypothetical protein [Gammaproteobacteria bacterium]